MTLPFTLPDWLPWWVPIVLLVPALLYALAFLFMPFSVIGVKSRLEVIEARLDEIQGEIRHLALRLPETGRAADYDEIYAPEPTVPAARAPPPVIDAPADPARLARAGGRISSRGTAARRTRTARREPDRGPRGRAEPQAGLAAVTVGCVRLQVRLF